MGKIRCLTLGILAIFLILIGCIQEQPYSPNADPGKIVGFIKPTTVDAEVVLSQGLSQKSTTTDSVGYFEFNSVTAGIYNLKISAKNFGSQVLNNIIVMPGQTTTLHDVCLKPYPEQIDAISPVDGAENIPLRTPIQIDFSTLMDHNSVESSFYLFPKQAGWFHWAISSGKSQLIFYPTDPYKTNFNYLVVLTTDARTIYGDSLAFELHNMFKTEGLTITSTTPADGATFVSPQAYLYINFNSNMDRQSTENNFAITPTKLGNFRWIDAQQACFQPGTYFASNTLYKVTLGAGTHDIHNTYLSSEMIFYFRTEPLTIVSSFPAHGATNISRSSPIIISFNTLVNQAAAENAFSVAPAIEGGKFQWSDLTRFQYTGTTRLLENTYYTITIDTTCSDAWGNKLLHNFACIFRTGD